MELPPTVVMKMDVEYMEWLVVPSLMNSGVLCKSINAVMGEFHYNAESYPITFEDEHHKAWTLETKDDARTFANQLLDMMRRDPLCKTDFVLKDDETHRSDGVPFPKAIRNKPAVHTMRGVSSD